ncbi:MAG: oligosaccharide flippase family protein [Clostridia bacterium]|nr:oligosaccharide flippase family protein [Clostridia bacterium]
MNNSNKQIKYGAIISYISIIINILISLIYLPWMVSAIGKSQYALYSLAGTFINIFLVDFGLSQATSRFLAKYRADNDREKEEKFISLVIKLYLIIDIIIFVILLILFFLIDNIYTGLTIEEIEVYKKLYIIVACYSIISFPFMPLSGILESNERFVSLKICGLGQKILSVVLTIIGLLLGADVIFLVLANAVSGIIFVIIKLILTSKILPFKMKKENDKKLLKTIFSFSIWVTISSIFSRIIFNLAPTLLGIFSNSTEIALFSTASAIEGFFYTFAAAINGLFLPKISRYIANKEDNKIFNLMLKVGKYQMSVLGLIFIGLICIGKDFFACWMGKGFENAAICAIVILIPDILTYSQQIANTEAVAKGLVKYQGMFAIVQAVVYCIFSILLCRIIGSLGIAISISLAYLINFILMNVFVFYKKLKIDIFKFYKACYLSYLLPYSITGLLGYWICNNIILIGGWKGLIIKAIIITVLYIIMVLVLAFNKNEKVNIKNKINSFLNEKLK